MVRWFKLNMHARMSVFADAFVHTHSEEDDDVDDVDVDGDDDDVVDGWAREVIIMARKILCLCKYCARRMRNDVYDGRRTTYVQVKIVNIHRHLYRNLLSAFS